MTKRTSLKKSKLPIKNSRFKAGAHSTIALLTLINQQFRCYCVGDSEVIYWNAAGTFNLPNVPHSTVGHEIRAGTLEQEESLDHPDRNYVMNMLGDELIHIEVAGQLDVKRTHHLGWNRWAV